VCGLLLSTDPEHQHAFFQQDSDTAHAAQMSMDAVREVFGNRIIRSGLSQAYFNDLNSCDLFKGNIKLKVFYRSNPHTTEEMRNSQMDV
jgi:hypothetical protein